MATEKIFSVVSFLFFFLSFFFAAVQYWSATSNRRVRAVDKDQYNRLIGGKQTITSPANTVDQLACPGLLEVTDVGLGESDDEELPSLLHHSLISFTTTAVTLQVYTITTLLDVGT